VSERDARRLGIGEGDLVELSTPRGCVVGAARICGIRDGVLFVPFHYGYWDTGGKVHHRAGNEMTLTDWDPVSKQPISELLNLTSRCHPEALRQMRWANAMLKELSPQVLMS
jgi:anaerobic selenocysteine-containing dehydrogenase